MKNMLGIKRISAVLLIGAMVGANSTMSTNASNDWIGNLEIGNDVLYAYLPEDAEEKDKEIEVNPIDDFGFNNMTPICNVLGVDPESHRFFHNEKQISPYTPFKKVEYNTYDRDDSMLIVTNDMHLPKSEIYKKTKEARNRTNVPVNFVNKYNGDARQVNLNVSDACMVDSALDMITEVVGVDEAVYDYVGNLGEPLQETELTVKELDTDKNGPPIVSYFRKDGDE